ncbi:hypothetical protein [Emticicia soli]|uniref:FCD domain-containing protein n=1 Tax=Emticicia soli TaxID=2027878 RepID=A0ABW5JEQ2_9BACT
MNKDYLEKIKILREKIPVGVTHALKILEKSGGNIDTAQELIKEEYTAILIHKTGVSREIAQHHLLINKFNVETALNSIEKVIYSITELILRRGNNKRDAIKLMLDAIERKIKAEVDKKKESEVYEWFNFELLNTLSPDLFTFAAIAKWLLYEDSEGFDYAVSFHTAIVTEQIETILLLPEIATYIRISRNRKAYFYQKYEHKKRGFMKAYDEIRQDSLYKNAEKAYHDNAELLIETLYNYVKTHIKQFP